LIRYAFIHQQILNIYRDLPEIRFPIDPHEVITMLPNCRFLSYQQFAELNGCSIKDVIRLCESRSGCTHYDAVNGRYLILCNQSTDWNNNEGRQRWTCGHEIGHVICGHHLLSANEKLSENGMLCVKPEFEAEADYFSATLLAPFPLFRCLDINSADDVKSVSGLSCEASFNQYEQYERWKKSHRKTAWENDIVKIYLMKECV